MDFLLKRGEQCVIKVGGGETEAVKIAVSNLRTDLEKTLGVSAKVTETGGAALPEIIICTRGVSEEFDSLADFDALRDEAGALRKEAYLQTVYEGKLVIAGSDRRGTIYGIYDFCEAIGVSPWYFWADVPVKQKEEFGLPGDYRKIDYPSIEYRGIFINDEEELEAWVQNYMGESTIGVKTYEKIFELLLRLKANYIWPAMHVNSFNMAVENGALAERMGIVVGTSHCDMLMRSNNREWKPWLAGKGYTDVEYDYSIPGRNRETLQEYWRESVEQNKDFEVCYTLGMRGIHDSGFETRDLQGKSEEEIRQAKVDLLSTIIRDQQQILKEALGHDTMMTFIPYKEVLELYDTGMEIPEELTLVWANDNYGYIRRYPSEKEKHRKGGNGIYYHNSYWAPPSMSYVFLCSIPLAHTRNELQKAYNEGIRKLWVLNSGAMKPLEQEITFFLRLAWEIGKENALTEDVDAYVEDWIDRTFTGSIGRETARLLNDFSQLTNVRKLENMDYDAFSQTAYGDEAAVRIHAYEELFQRGNVLYESLPQEERDAFFQLVLMRIHAAYFTNLQYYYGDRSTLMHDRGNMQAAALYTKKAFEMDDARRKLLVYYNQIMAEGKWNGIVNPEGFPPPRAAMMPVCTPPLAIGKQSMRVDVWNEGQEICFVKPGEKWLELGNGGEGEFAFSIQAPDWVELSEENGVVRTEKRILVSVKACTENRQGKLVVRKLQGRTDTVGTSLKDATEDAAQVMIPIKTIALHTSCENVEEDGKLVVDAASVSCGGTGFHVIRRLGRGRGSLVEAGAGRDSLARTGAAQSLAAAAEQGKADSLALGASDVAAKGLTYPVYLTSTGAFTLEIHRFPSLNSTGRIRIGVSVDGGSVQMVESPSTDEWRGSWKENVLNNVDRLYLQLPVLEAGEHTITFYPVDKYFAFSRFVIYTEERKPNNYIGIAGGQELPMLWNSKSWIKSFYEKDGKEIVLKPRPVEYAQVEKETDTLVKADLVKCEGHYAETVEPGWYLEQGRSIFAEAGSDCGTGVIKIDAASVLAQSGFAYTSRCRWQHCSSESYGRSGLAMYVRERSLKWQAEEAPALNYKLKCSGGEYTVWLLAKCNVKEESFFGVGLDGVVIPAEKLYNKGSMWRYEAEQIYRWVPLGRISMEPGEHILQILALASGMRFDRIYLTQGEELPPTDNEWK